MKLNKDYSFRVGVRKATGNVVANTVVAATPAGILVTALRYNGIDLWPEALDVSVGLTFMTFLTGLTRWLGDFHRVNIVEPRYKARNEP